jgi:capsular exopolysaccharide synthesis family protein
MVTSAAPAEGKTTTTVHLALAHAQQNHKTLLIDGDFRRPSVHTRLGLNPSLGLASAMQNGFRWREKIINLEGVPNLDILPTGPSSRRAADLIGPRLPAILEQAGLEYDLIFIDAPPLLGFPEPLQMAAAVDGVIIVAQAGQTDRKAVGAVLNTLKRVRANVIGLVLNEVTQEMGDTYSYYGKYYKYYRSDS